MTKNCTAVLSIHIPNPLLWYKHTPRTGECFVLKERSGLIHPTEDVGLGCTEYCHVVTVSKNIQSHHWAARDINFSHLLTPIFPSCYRNICIFEESSSTLWQTWNFLTVLKLFARRYYSHSAVAQEERTWLTVPAMNYYIGTRGLILKASTNQDHQH